MAVVGLVANVRVMPWVQCGAGGWCVATATVVLGNRVQVRFVFGSILGDHQDDVQVVTS